MRLDFRTCSSKVSSLLSSSISIDEGDFMSDLRVKCTFLMRKNISSKKYDVFTRLPTKNYLMSWCENCRAVRELISSSTLARRILIGVVSSW